MAGEDLVSLLDSQLESQLGHTVVTLGRHTGPVLDVASAANGHVLTCSDDNTVMVFLGDQHVRTIQAHAGGVEAVAVLPGGARFVSGSQDGTAKLWTLDGSLERTFEVGSYMTCVAALPDGEHFVVGLGGGHIDRGEVRLYHVDGTRVHTFERHANLLNAVAVTPDGQQIISGGFDNLVKV